MPLKMFQRSPEGPWYVRGTIRVGKNSSGQVFRSSGLTDFREAQLFKDKLETEIKHQLMFKPAQGAIFGSRRLRDDGYVYLMRASDGRIKVGTSIHPSKRRRHLEGARGEKLDIVATIRGGIEIEGIVKAIFSPYRRYGEWFELPAEAIEGFRSLGKKLTQIRAKARASEEAKSA